MDIMIIPKHGKLEFLCEESRWGEVSVSQFLSLPMLKLHFISIQLWCIFTISVIYLSPKSKVKNVFVYDNVLLVRTNIIIIYYFRYQIINTF